MTALFPEFSNSADTGEYDTPGDMCARCGERYADEHDPDGLCGRCGETEAERRADWAHDYPERAIAQAFRNVAAEARPGR